MSADNVFGSPIHRVDGMAKVTGAAKFSGDQYRDGILHAALVKSTYARGRIRSIDASAALEQPGVVAVVTAADLERADCVDSQYGVVVRDRSVLASDGRVRFVGDPVAVVLAQSRQVARQATRLVTVDIEELPAATDLRRALAPGAPLVHEGPYPPAEDLYAAPAPLHYGESNLVMTYEVAKGDVTAAFEQADQVIESSYTFPAVYHYALEPHTVVADCRAGEINVWSSAQHPNQVQLDLARMWALPLSAVRVVASYVGGGFGSKSFTHVEPLAVAASMSVGRPVRLELDVSEAMAVSRRHGLSATSRVALDAGGNLTGYEAELTYDGGAYTLLGPYVVAKGAYRALGGYSFPAYAVTSHLVYTNTSPAGSFRAIGGPQAAWVLERSLDRAARASGRGSLRFRADLLAKRGEEFRPGRTPMDADLQATADELFKADLTQREAARALPDPLAALPRGHGCAFGISDPGAAAISTAIVRLLADGSCVVAIGSSELGQGVRTAITQIVSRTLALDPARIRVLVTDTVSGPFDSSTGASRSTTMSGLAAHRAALNIKKRLVDHVGATSDVDADELRVEDGHVVAAHGASFEFGTLVKQIFGGRGGALIGVGEVLQQEFPTTPPFWEVAGGQAQVSVDPVTGEVKVESYTSVSDVGRVVNPTMMAGQESGAFAQGLGHSLFEELRWDEGQPVTDSLVNYRVPRARDIPATFHSVTIENEDGPGPFGLRGGGEGPIIPVAPAIAIAVADACGVDLTDLPLTPEKVWRELVRQGRAVNYAASQGWGDEGGPQ